MGQDLSASGGRTQRPAWWGWRGHGAWLISHSPCLLRECSGHGLRSGHPQGTHEGVHFHGLFLCPGSSGWAVRSAVGVQSPRPSGFNEVCFCHLQNLSGLGPECPLLAPLVTYRPLNVGGQPASAPVCPWCPWRWPPRRWGPFSGLSVGWPKQRPRLFKGRVP